jgi:hypothetical protein
MVETESAPSQYPVVEQIISADGTGAFMGLDKA